MNTKNCGFIYNKYASGFKEKNLPKIIEAIIDEGYNPVPIESEYAGYIIDNIHELNNQLDILLTMGGDGTVSEAYEAFHSLTEPQKAIYGHIPGGTTNDMGPNTYIPRYDPVNATTLLLNGTVEAREIIMVNNQPIAYVAAGGILAPTTFLIDKSSDKKDAGTFSYLRYGASQIFHNKELYRNIIKNPYQIRYTASGKTVETEAIFFAIFNGRSFGNLNINPTANMCDNNFEVAIIHNQSEIFKALPHCTPFSKEGVMALGEDCTFSADNLELTFTDDRTPFYPINCDGDAKDLLAETSTLEAKSGGKIFQLTGRY